MSFLVVTKKQLLFSLSCFILGLFTGLTSSLLYSGAAIDQKVIELETLYSELSERESRIERLEESLADQRYRVVKDIKLKMNIKDPHLNLKLSDHIRQLLTDLIGQEIGTTDPDLVRNIIDNRVIFMNEQAYTLTLTFLVIAETLTAEIHVTTGIIQNE